MAARAPAAYTYDDLLRFPEDNVRREIIGGELFVTSSPRVRHHRVVMELGVGLYLYAKAQGGEAFASPLDIYFTHSDVVQPDVLFFTREQLECLEEPLERPIKVVPTVIAEVSSPSTRRRDLLLKRDLYECFGVPEYWFVDLDADRVEAYRLADGRYPAPVLLGRSETLTAAVLPGFALAVGELLGAEA